MEQRRAWTLPTDFPVRSSTVLMRAPSRPNCSQRASGSQPGSGRATISSLTATPDSSSPHLACRTPASPSAGFPVYNLYLAKPGAPIEPAFLLSDLSLSNYTYLIVDARMAYDVPELGVYFTSNDPASVQPQGSKSPFYGRLNKFNTIQWMVKVFQSDNYSIYRFIQLTAPIGYQQQPPTSAGKQGKVLQGKLLVTP